MTAAEITDARLDAISYARDVLERARAEHVAWHGSGSLHRVTAAMGPLRAALRAWDDASGDGRDEAAAEAGSCAARVAAVIEDVMGPDAAAYVRTGHGSGEEWWAA